MDHNPDYGGGPDLGYFDHHGRHTQHHEQHSPWIESAGYHSHHASPVTEYPHFAFGSPPSTIGPGPYYPNSIQPHTRPAHHQLQPLITPTWPSMLTSSPTSTHQHHSAPYSNQNHHVLPPPPPQPIHPSPIQSGPVSAPPQLSSHSHGPPASTPRRTLTDSDRRKMCLYHEEHPHKKQTEIGEIFGVERSTVSKVLRQKDKYLHQEDGSRSPIKKPKDEHIRSQAKLFWLAAGSGGDCPVNFDSPQWLEKFKQKLKGTSLKGRSGGSVTSPVTPSGAHSATISPVTGVGGAYLESPVSARASANSGHLGHGLGIAPSHSAPPRQPLHMQSNTSLSSAFTEAAGTNTSMSSPMFSPEDVHPAQTSYFPSSTSAPPLDLLAQRRQAYPLTTTSNLSDSVATLSPGTTLHRTPVDGESYLASAYHSHITQNSSASSLHDSNAMDTDMPPPSSVSAPPSQTQFDSQQTRRASQGPTSVIAETPPILAQAFRRPSPPTITTSLPTASNSFYSPDTARPQLHSHSYPPQRAPSQLQVQKQPRPAVSTPPTSTPSTHPQLHAQPSTSVPSVDEARQGLEVALAFVKANRLRDGFAASVGVPTVQEDDESALVRILEKLGSKGVQNSPRLHHQQQQHQQLITPISAVSADLNTATPVSASAVPALANYTSAPDAAITSVSAPPGMTLHTIQEATAMD